MDGFGPYAVARELRGEAICAAARAAEHDRRTGNRHEAGGDARAIRAFDLPEHVVCATPVGFGFADVVAYRVVLVVAGKYGDRAVECGGEQECLTLARCEIEQAPDLGK